jgi:hypothetical protein
MLIVIDTSHGHSANVINAVKTLKNTFDDFELIAGNVGTAKGAEDLVNAGVDGVKIGIGGGSICTTRIIAGIGVPQLTAITNCRSIAAKTDVPLIADGGIRFLRRYHQGHRRRCTLYYGRRTFGRYRREPGGGGLLSRPQLQNVSGHGLG